MCTLPGRSSLIATGSLLPTYSHDMSRVILTPHPASSSELTSIKKYDSPFTFFGEWGGSKEGWKLTTYSKNKDVNFLRVSEQPSVSYSRLHESSVAFIPDARRSCCNTPTACENESALHGLAFIYLGFST